MAGTPTRVTGHLHVAAQGLSRPSCGRPFVRVVLGWALPRPPGPAAGSAERSRCRRVASGGRDRRPSATARTPTADPSTVHRSAPATGSHRSASAGPTTAAPTPQQATTAPAPPTAHQKDPLAPHRDHHGARRGTEPTFKTRSSRVVRPGMRWVPGCWFRGGEVVTKAGCDHGSRARSRPTSPSRSRIVAASVSIVWATTRASVPWARWAAAYSSAGQEPRGWPMGNRSMRVLHGEGSRHRRSPSS